MKTVTKDFSYRGEHFSIVFDGRFYMTVNHKLIGDDGHPVRTLNYCDGLHPADSVSECIKLTKQDLDLEYLMSIGKSRAEAFAEVLDIPLEMAQQLFEKEIA